MDKTVIYILGHERSGSTLLQNILGQSEEIEALGELRHFWKRQKDFGNCGCGKKVLECEYWKQMFDGVSSFDQKSRKHIPERFFPILSLPFIRSTLFMFWRRHIDFQRVFYMNIMKATKSDYIVDSSKSLVHFYLLSKVLKLKVITIQILRHPCGIEYSLYKRKMKVSRNYNKHHYLLSSILSDIRYYFYRLFLKRYALQSHILRYEDLINNYDSTLGDLRERLSLSDDFPKKESDNIHMNPTHTVGGSPSRFKHGKIELKLDDEWSEKLPSFIIKRLKTTSLIYKRFYKT